MKAKFRSNEFDIRLADSFWKRFMGLMGKKSMPEKEGLLFRKCGSIHCFFMKMPIDVIYLDRNDQVLYAETVAPWHIGKMVKGAKSVLEVNAGEASNIVNHELMRLEVE